MMDAQAVTKQAQEYRLLIESGDVSAPKMAEIISFLKDQGMTFKDQPNGRPDN